MARETDPRNNERDARRLRSRHGFTKRSNGCTRATRERIRLSVPPWSTDLMHPLVDRARESMLAAGCRWIPRPGSWDRLGMGTVGGVVSREFGIPTIGYGPGEEQEAQACNESVSLSAVVDAVYGTAISLARVELRTTRSSLGRCSRRRRASRHMRRIRRKRMNRYLCGCWLRSACSFAWCLGRWPSEPFDGQITGVERAVLHVEGRHPGNGAARRHRSRRQGGGWSCLLRQTAKSRLWMHGSVSFLEEGQSHYEGYALFRFGDGSTQTARLVGCRSASGAETGEFSFVCGSGRFQGITGTGNFSNDGFSLTKGPFVHAQSTYRLLTD